MPSGHGEEGHPGTAVLLVAVSTLTPKKRRNKKGAPLGNRVFSALPSFPAFHKAEPPPPRGDLIAVEVQPTPHGPDAQLSVANNSGVASMWVCPFRNQIPKNRLLIPTILSNHHSFQKPSFLFWVSGGFLESRIPGKNGEGTLSL